MKKIVLQNEEELHNIFVETKLEEGDILILNNDIVLSKNLDITVPVTIQLKGSKKTIDTTKFHLNFLAPCQIVR